MSLLGKEVLCDFGGRWFSQGLIPNHRRQINGRGSFAEHVESGDLSDASDDARKFN